MAVSVKTGDTFEPEAPRGLFDTTLPTTPPRQTYSVSPDGQRFLVTASIEPFTTLFIPIQNWTSALRKRPGMGAVGRRGGMLRCSVGDYSRRAGYSRKCRNGHAHCGYTLRAAGVGAEKPACRTVARHGAPTPAQWTRSPL